MPWLSHQVPNSGTLKRMAATCIIPDYPPKAEMKPTGFYSVGQDAERRIYVMKNPQGPQMYILVVQLRDDCNNQASELGEQ